MNKQTNAPLLDGSGKAAPQAAPEPETKRPYAGPSVQTREAERLRGLLANVSAATGFVQP